MKRKTILLVLCIGRNLVLTIVMVRANMVALERGYEETFVALALWYGIAVTMANASLLWLAGRNSV